MAWPEVVERTGGGGRRVGLDICMCSGGVTEGGEPRAAGLRKRAVEDRCGAKRLRGRLAVAWSGLVAARGRCSETEPGRPAGERAR